jgi:putative glutamine amidotransferase
MRRPAIGVPTALEHAQYGVWDVPCALLNIAYVEALQRAGALVVMIPPDPALVADPDEILGRLDALMLAGGSDIDPAAYGATPHPLTVGVVPARDAAELALTRRALELDLPVLGICRGMQVINVALGGTLHQDLPERLGHGEHRRNLGSFEGSEHDVELEPHSLAARAAGERVHATCSHHHQGIDRVGEGLIVTGRSPADGLVEAIEAPESDYVLGVQWHPEADPASGVVAAFVAHVRERTLACADDAAQRGSRGSA